MSTYTTREQAVAVFSHLFEIMLQDETFTSTMRRDGLSVRFVHTAPEFEMYVDPDGVRIDDSPATAALAIKMSCDTAHALWSGHLLMPVAVAMGRIRIKGSVAKVIEFAPLLQPAFDRYPAIAREAGVAA